jgi:GNAT superfamily N-acetyltransferase
VLDRKENTRRASRVPDRELLMPIRLATPADVEELARLRWDFRTELQQASEPEAVFLARCARWMVERLEPAGGWHAWLATEADVAVGTAWLHLIEKLPNPVAEPECHGYVSSLYVAPAHRGTGIGSALLSECLAECDRRTVDAVMLWPTPRSRALYLRHGFAVRDDLLERRAAGTG